MSISTFALTLVDGRVDMEANKRYVTQLTESDMRELAEVTKLTPGDGLYINRENGRIFIGIDRDKLRALLGIIYD